MFMGAYASIASDLDIQARQPRQSYPIETIDKFDCDKNHMNKQMDW